MPESEGFKPVVGAWATPALFSPPISVVPAAVPSLAQSVLLLPKSAVTKIALEPIEAIFPCTSIGCIALIPDTPWFSVPPTSVVPALVPLVTHKDCVLEVES